MAHCGRNWDVRTDVYNRKTFVSNFRRISWAVWKLWRNTDVAELREAFSWFCCGHVSFRVLKTPVIESDHRVYVQLYHRSALFLVSFFSFSFIPLFSFFLNFLCLLFVFLPVFLSSVFLSSPSSKPPSMSQVSFFFYCASANHTNCAARVFLAMPPFRVDVMTLLTGVLSPPNRVLNGFV